MGHRGGLTHGIKSNEIAVLARQSLTSETRDTAVGRANGWTTKSKFLVPSKGKTFISSPERPEGLRDAIILLFNGYCGCLPRG